MFGPRITVVVDARAPTGIYARGLPVGAEHAITDTIRIISWPSRAGDPTPEYARVPGTVIWSVQGRPGATRWEPVDDTLGLLILLEPTPLGETYRLQAELRPEHAEYHDTRRMRVSE